MKRCFLKTIFVFLSLFGSLIFAPVLADKIVLKNGNVLSGEIKGERDNKLILQLNLQEGKGEIAIPKSTIKTILRSSPSGKTNKLVVVSSRLFDFSFTIDGDYCHTLSRERLGKEELDKSEIIVCKGKKMNTGVTAFISRNWLWKVGQLWIFQKRHCPVDFRFPEMKFTGVKKIVNNKKGILLRLNWDSAKLSRRLCLIHIFPRNSSLSAMLVLQYIPGDDKKMTSLINSVEFGEDKITNVRLSSYLVSFRRFFQSKKNIIIFPLIYGLFSFSQTTTNTFMISLGIALNVFLIYLLTFIFRVPSFWRSIVAFFVFRGVLAVVIGLSVFLLNFLALHTLFLNHLIIWWFSLSTLGKILVKILVLTTAIGSIFCFSWWVATRIFKVPLILGMVMGLFLIGSVVILVLFTLFPGVERRLLIGT